MRQKEEEAKKKAEAKKAQAAAAGDTEKAKKKQNEDDEDLDPSKYTENRRNFVQNLRNNGINPYPHKFSRTHRIDQFKT